MRTGCSRYGRDSERASTRSRWSAPALALALGLAACGAGGGGSDAPPDGGPATDGEAGPLPGLPWDEPRLDEDACFDEEILILRDLRARAQELDRRESALDERERALAGLEAQVGVRLGELEAIRAELLALARREQAASAERVGELASMVDTMKAEEAAVLLSGMDADVALLVLREIKPKQAGRILGAMAPGVGRRLGDRMTVMPDPRDAGAAGTRGEP